MMRFSYISLLLLIIACAPVNRSLQPATADATCIQKFKPVFNADLYGASIDVIGKHLSGLLLFKTMADSTLRLVFTNEAGLTFFDFEFHRNGDFAVKHVLDQLNKRPVIKTLQKDFEMVMMKTSGAATTFVENDYFLFAFKNQKDTDYFITNKDCSKLLQLEKRNRNKLKTKVTLFGEYYHAPDSIHISHRTFKMEMKLKKLRKLEN
jgi:hypothetical protein